MSHLNKLLEGVEVDWKTLAEVANFSNGKGHEKEITDDGKYIVVNSRFISTDGKVAKYSNNQLCPLFIDDILIVMSDLPNGKALAKTFLVDENEKYTLNQRIGGISIKNKSELFPKFLNYFLDRTGQLRKYNNGIDQTNLQKQQILQVPIPIPSLSVQKEIVRVLDSFTTLTTEISTALSTELTARKQQYNFYREQLFSFEEGEVEWKMLNQIGEFQRGKRFVKTDMISEGIPCIHYGEMYTHFDTWADKSKSFLNKEFVENRKLRVAEKNDVVIVAAGETIEDLGKGTAWLGEEGVVIHDACFSFRSPLNPKYFAYYTRTKQYHNQIIRNISSGKISAIHSKGLSSVIIPVPSLKVQERIVSILDQFDTLTSSISEGLPKEIALRKQQYEYYRDRLLTFKK
jgi:type I restriction enzyme S subunit